LNINPESYCPGFLEALTNSLIPHLKYLHVDTLTDILLATTTWNITIVSRDLLTKVFEAFILKSNECNPKSILITLQFLSTAFVDLESFDVTIVVTFLRRSHFALVNCTSQDLRRIIVALTKVSSTNPQIASQLLHPTDRGDSWMAAYCRAMSLKLVDLTAEELYQIYYTLSKPISYLSSLY